MRSAVTVLLTATSDHLLLPIAADPGLGLGLGLGLGEPQPCIGPRWSGSAPVSTVARLREAASLPACLLDREKETGNTVRKTAPRAWTSRRRQRDNVHGIHRRSCGATTYPPGVTTLDSLFLEARFGRGSGPRERQPSALSGQPETRSRRCCTLYDY
jgi:hypothetical protein